MAENISTMLNTIKDKFIMYNTNQWDGKKGIEIGYLPIAKPLASGESIFFLFIKGGTRVPFYLHKNCDTTISIIEGLGDIHIMTHHNVGDIARESTDRVGKYNKFTIPRNTPYGWTIKKDTYLLVSQTDEGMFKEGESKEVDFRFYRKLRKKRGPHSR